jgi:hypothetical protein
MSSALGKKKEANRASAMRFNIRRTMGIVIWSVFIDFVQI